jgi:hypothetical protein
MQPTTEDVIRRWFREVWSERKPEVIEELFVPERNGVTGLAPNPIGPKEFRGFWDLITGAVKDTAVTIEHMMCRDTEALFLGVLRGAHTRNGAPIEIRFAGHATVKNGKIVDATNVVDFLALLQQVGACDADLLGRSLASA